MVYFKALIFAFLLLATDVLAVAVRCTFSVTVTDIESGKPGHRTSKMAEVDQDKADSIVANMATWSGGKYRAQRSRVPNMITVTGTTTSSQANAMVQDMQRVVSANYRE
jgi:hypothetical protein